MAMSTVMRNAKEGIRPAWNYIGQNNRGIDLDTLEMIESVRNAIEQLQRSQMLQCDVAIAIKTIRNELFAMNKEIRGLRRDLKGLCKRK